MIMSKCESNFKCKNFVLLSRLIFLIIFFVGCFVGFCPKVYASDTRITFGTQVMAYVFDKYEDCHFLVKYRKDKKFVGVLIINPENKKENMLKIFDCETGLETFEYAQKDKEITDFNFKKNAVIMTYKSTFWEEKAAYDLFSGKFVRRYSSLLANVNSPKLVEK
jgi:hypothetical protein